MGFCVHRGFWLMWLPVLVPFPCVPVLVLRCTYYLCPSIGSLVCSLFGGHGLDFREMSYCDRTSSSSSSSSLSSSRSTSRPSLYFSFGFPPLPRSLLDDPPSHTRAELDAYGRWWCQHRLLSPRTWNGVCVRHEARPCLSRPDGRLSDSIDLIDWWLWDCLIVRL